MLFDIKQIYILDIFLHKSPNIPLKKTLRLNSTDNRHYRHLYT